MATFSSFEEIKAWQKAKTLTVELYRATQQGEVSRDFDLIRQMRRAAISVTSNIAEGFERQTKKEFIQYLFIAKGSVGELRSQLIVTGELEYLGDDIIEDLKLKCIEISKMLANLIKYLKQD